MVTIGGAGDASLIVRLIHESFREYEDRLDPPSAALNETAESVAKELHDGATSFVATIDGVAAGCVIARPKGRNLYFGRLAVLPAFRGLGIARLLVGAVEGESVRRGCDGVVLAVRIALPENQRFFARLGYVEVSRSAHPGFVEATAIEMSKHVINPARGNVAELL